MRTITVVGASLAGLYTATALRDQGFDGRLVIAGDEPHRPYDRPPLSKGFLTGDLTREQIALAPAEDEAALDAEWLLGARARRLEPGSRTVEFEDGRRVTTDGLVIATGAAARWLPGERLAGVHTLRTLDDAEALGAELSAGQRQIVVIGGGFIGAEVASSCAAGGHLVTVVEAALQPLIGQLGEAMAHECAKLHADHGVQLLCGTGVASLLDDGAGRVRGVELSDGRTLDADVVVVGIGASPSTGWLEDSGLPLDDGVVADAGCVTPVPGIVAVGDVVRTAGSRAEHWSSATAQAGIAARNLLAGATVETHRPLPYFWSDQYGTRLQFAGRHRPGDTVRIAEGSPDDRSFLAVYENPETGGTTAALALNRPRAFTRTRRALARETLPAAL
ncbi:FAD-dependent oxidoreductase [Streptomyces sp. HNM0574]|uniref:NAD(P)/FAD-dependent oxidoreductase n=1 Tax=Streptomyces sp. HNM0574 TaxID=2714954 RepID=UPI001469CA8B|nr:FAD-dependent oxidoreductase [Streptomyces sp. HNM0574]NLU69919.1 FAD-dependent oxidoreductase [Streptomyces sp. HNM0574]